MDNNNNNSTLKTKWRNRFIIAAIIQGGIMTGMALIIVGFQLSITGAVGTGKLYRKERFHTSMIIRLQI